MNETPSLLNDTPSQAQAAGLQRQLLERGSASPDSPACGGTPRPSGTTVFPASTAPDGPVAAPPSHPRAPVGAVTSPEAAGGDTPQRGTMGGGGDASMAAAAAAAAAAEQLASAEARRLSSPWAAPARCWLLLAVERVGP